MLKEKNNDELELKKALAILQVKFRDKNRDFLLQTILSLGVKIKQQELEIKRLKGE